MMRRAVALSFFTFLAGFQGAAYATGVPTTAFTNYEMGQTHPLELTPDGTRLLSVNTANGTLEIFDVSGATVSLKSVIKVGVEPVSVRALSNTQAWVVNGISDSVNVVDIQNNVVTATLRTDNQPADVIFAGSPLRAYVSVAQAKELMVFDPAAPIAPIARIPVLGQQPRALAVSKDGSKIYLAIFESGNGTTAITGGKVDAPIEVDLARFPSNPYKGVSPFPDIANGGTYTNLYGAGTPNPPPPVSVIVRRKPAGTTQPFWLDENGVDWSAFINGNLSALGSQADRAPGWDLIDRDVAIIDTATQNITYQSGPLNIVMSIAVNPASGQITTIGTDATNQIRYQPVLDGKFIKVLLGEFTPGQASVGVDLNPHLAPYNVSSIPMACSTANPSVCRQNSIGDPRGIAWNAAGSKAYVTGMGSNNLIVINSAGARAGLSTAPIGVGQGPTGIVLQESQSRAFVLNRFDATISIVSLASEKVTGTVALSYDPTPAVVVAGRPLLYNTTTTSGLGHIACASCHVDAKTDRLAWDLGDPTAPMSSSIDSTTQPPTTIPQHPMKGPLLTMTLVDTMQSPFFHWRGDRANLQAFAPAFRDLQGADGPATTAQINALHDYLATLRTPPDPFRTLANQYSMEVAVPGPRGYPYRTGNAVAGAQEFEADCGSCHVGDTGRGANFVDNGFGVNQFRNPPKWQNFYRREGLWFGDATASTTGFGFQQDGTFDSTHNGTRSDNMMAFMYSFNGSFPYEPAGLNATNVAVDSPAALGKQVTLSGSVTNDPLLPQLLALAGAGQIDLVASGCVANETRGFVYAGNSTFKSDRAETYSLAQLSAIAAGGSPITFTGVGIGTGIRIGIDADADGLGDGLNGATPTRICHSGALPNLLVNGSFETNSIAPGNWGNVASVLGWTGSQGVIQAWNQLYGWSAADGNSWIQIDATAGADAVSQTVATTAGDQLVLRFWYSARPGVSAASNQFDVVWNGVVIDRIAPEGTVLTTPSWQQAQYVVRATGSDKLTFVESGISDTVGALLDAVSLVDVAPSSAAFVSPAVNLAYGKNATESSVILGASASRAVDGNIDGAFFDGSVSHTAQNAPQDWWQVDLGAVSTVRNVDLFNRTDCCATRLNNFYVFVSPTDMTGQTLAQILANPAVSRQYVAAAGYVHENITQLLSVDFNGATGRYVRVQLAGSNALHLAEVKVMGWAPGAR